MVLTMKKTLKSKKGLRKRTRRMRGGATMAELQAIIDAVPLEPNMTINPSSKFVVVTYWWGRGIKNRNTQVPCPDAIKSVIKEGLEEELVEEDEEYRELFNTFITARNLIRKGRYTTKQEANYKRLSDERKTYLGNYFKRPNIIAVINKKFLETPTTTPPKLFEVMIEDWKKACVAAGCNYLAVEYPQFATPANYQSGINAKPLFIKKALTVCQGRSVLYIDGDMFINKYPNIFDMKNVDFMARGWNVDPRANEVYAKNVCYDPYIFETSGGIMYFAPTTPATKLLDAWVAETSLPVNKGKADDRILSQVFTRERFAIFTNFIQLPIEYLWLTDLYTYHKGADASQAESFVEHPACLTTEEAAREQGASDDRQPFNYTKQIEKAIDCDTKDGLLFEYIFYDDKKMVPAFEPYLKFAEKVQPRINRPLFTVIPYDDKYGPYTTIAMKNWDKVKNMSIPSKFDTKLINLPVSSEIPLILYYLNKGVNVNVGIVGPMDPTTEIGCSIVGSKLSHYLKDLNIYTSGSMFFSSKSMIVRHLLAMCENKESLNYILHQSSMFLSRIRWQFYKIMRPIGTTPQSV
jgi:hypothetical protein